MAKRNFARIMEHIFEFEGDYVDHPRDPGGATNMGITFATLRAWRGKPITKTDVKNLTKSEAMEIYRKNYWDKVRGDDLPGGLDLVAMDAAVNSGPGRGAKWLQAALGVTQDGAIGPMTVEAAKRANVPAVINSAVGRREAFLRRLSTFDVFGRGWMRRTGAVRSLAHALVGPGDIVQELTASEPVHQFPNKPNGFAAFLEALLSFFRRR